MRKRRQIELFSISFLDLLSGALGAVIILYVAIPKNKPTSVIEAKDDLLQESLMQELAQNKKEISELKAKLAATPISNIPVKIEDSSNDKNVDVGFKFKGKNILFLIDTSFSMTEEDRMGQVKAGIKMLITSLPKEYKVDIVQFPYGSRGPFKSLWGTPREISDFNKLDIFDFIYALYPRGGTPTREALLFILKNYEGVTDIVLLSDGAPTFHNSNKKDDIHDILRVVRESNPNKVQINCIGVGSDFIKDKQSERYQFLSLLSQETNGFFVGF